VEGGADGAGEVLLPGLRGDRAAAGAVPHHASRLGRAEPAGDDPVRERARSATGSRTVGERPAPAAEPTERALRPGRCRPQPVDPGGPGGHLHHGPATAARADRGACDGGRATARRRHARAGARQGPRTVTARAWVYVRDDAPFGGPDPPAALFRYSRDRKGLHPQAHLAGYAGILQADAYSGFNELYKPDRPGGPILEAACWAHARRKFFELAAIGRKGKDARPASPLALEAVQRIDALFDIERAINGLPADERHRHRQAHSAKPVAELEAWLREARARMSRHSETAKAMDYMLTRWDSFARFLQDGRICLTNNAAERALRGIALGRKSWLFAGSDRGGERAAFMYTLIGTAKMNGVNPQAWLADVLGRIAGHPAQCLHELLPWNWTPPAQGAAAA